jgi:acyl-coenzyme A thioesterase PaaI-like protein
VRKKYFMTVELTIKFIRPLEIGTPVTVTGRATKHSTRFSEGEGEITGPDGTVYSRAFGRYFIVPDPQTKLVHDYLTFHNDDIDILGSQPG